MRLRVRYTKLGKVRFVGHRDLARVWERTIRRAELPIAYTEGFSPRPKLHFGLALSVGHESDAEYLDIDLRDSIEVEGIAERLDAEMPTGVGVTSVQVIDRSDDALQQAVVACTWSFRLPGVTAAEASAAVQHVLDAVALPLEIERKGVRTTVDARPHITSLIVNPAGAPPTDDGCEVVVVLRRGERSLRPNELLKLLLASQLQVDPTLVRIRRIEQWIDIDGSLRAVMPAAGEPSTPPLQVAH